MLIRFIVALFLLFSSEINAQVCDLFVAGCVRDAHDDGALEYAQVYVLETNRGVLTDSLGCFTIEGLCAGTVALVFSHLYCEPDTVVINLAASISGQFFFLEHHAELLKTIEILSQKDRQTNLLGVAVSEVQQSEIASTSVTESLSRLNGVYVTGSGSNLAKPMIDGLLGNRIQIINLGVTQTDQQWGNDHAPALNVLQAASIQVLRGAAAVAYGPEAVAGAIVIQQADLKGLSDKLNQNLVLTGQSNGLGGNFGYQLGRKSARGFFWRLGGALARFGDRSTPNYVLSNTGLMEHSALCEIGFEPQQKQFLRISLASYFSQPGVLRSAHIGNLTDLNAAIASNKPWFVAPFGYKINEPSQKINHQTATMVWTVQPELEIKHQVTASFQYNQRKEFDSRRGGRSDLPSLHLRLYVPAIEATTTRVYANRRLNYGLQTQAQYNFNVFGTGFLPLLPDYDQHTVGAFSTHRWLFEKSEFELGLRTDYRHLNAFLVEGSQRTKKTHQFGVWAVHAGFTKQHKYARWGFNLGANQRPPAVIELYSRGLHQGIASFELGDVTLKPERSIKLSATHKRVQGKMQLETDVFFQSFEDFIFLQPLSQPILTIRGAYPAFEYKQNDALLGGVTCAIQYNATSYWSLHGKGSMLRHRNLNTRKPLVFQPADRVGAELRYTGKTVVFLGADRVGSQRLTPKDTDFLPPPAGYWLFRTGAKKTFELPQGHTLEVQCNVENAANRSYRDYLNRLRYFSDEQGRNFRFVAKYSF